MFPHFTRCGFRTSAIPHFTRVPSGTKRGLVSCHSLPTRLPGRTSKPLYMASLILSKRRPIIPPWRLFIHNVYLRPNISTVKISGGCRNRELEGGGQTMYSTGAGHPNPDMSSGKHWCDSKLTTIQQFVTVG